TGITHYTRLLQGFAVMTGPQIHSHEFTGRAASSGLVRLNCRVRCEKRAEDDIVLLYSFLLPPSAAGDSTRARNSSVSVAAWRTVKMKGWSQRISNDGGVLIRADFSIITTAVTAAASVPSSFTATRPTKRNG